MNEQFYVVIMAGGIGSRFWPKSRTGHPKQFLDILNEGKTLIQSTFARFEKFIPVENIFIVTTREYEGLIKKQLPKAKHENILYEPSRKNTAPCIAYASYKLALNNPDAKLICAPADHLIQDEDNFQRVCMRALDFVDHLNAFITLGIKPTYPNTGYGYIQHEAMAAADNIYKVKTFTEKPNAELAKTFLASGDFLWNAGIFVWKVRNILTAFEKYLPEMHELFQAELSEFNTPGETAAIERIYPQCTNISIDYGIMEQADNVYVIPSSFGWSDLGTWNSAYENLEKDYLENAVVGNNVVIIDSTHCMVQADEKKLLLLQGLDDFIVVDTPDVLLICKKDKEQEIKEYVAEIKRKKGEKFL
jgi:mannose-1-phosphate guanylyltransferase